MVGALHPLHFLLKLKEAIHQCFSCGGAAGHIDVNRNNSVTAPDNSIRVVIITPTIGTATHAHHPTWLWHLIVDFSEGWRHLICESSCNNNDISLTGRSSEDNSIPAPVDKVINPGKGPFHFICLEVHLERRVAMAFDPVRNAGALNLVHRGHLCACRALCVKQGDGRRPRPGNLSWQAQHLSAGALLLAIGGAFSAPATRRRLSCRSESSNKSL